MTGSDSVESTLQHALSNITIAIDPALALHLEISTRHKDSRCLTMERPGYAVQCSNQFGFLSFQFTNYTAHPGPPGEGKAFCTSGYTSSQVGRKWFVRAYQTNPGSSRLPCVNIRSLYPGESVSGPAELAACSCCASSTSRGGQLCSAVQRFAGVPWALFDWRAPRPGCRPKEGWVPGNPSRVSKESRECLKARTHDPEKVLGVPKDPCGS